MNITERFAKEELSKDDRSAPVLVFVLLMGFLLFLQLWSGSRLLEHPDTYWHIAVGQRIWQTGSLPRIDELSHTFQGHPWIANDWLIELLMFAAYNLGGWRTVVLLTACTIAATYALLYLVLSRRLRLTVAVGVAAVAYVFSMVNFLARPHIFAFPLMIIWFAGLVRAIETKASPPPLLLLVMALWANVHGSFTLGLAFTGLLGAEAVFDSEPSARIRTIARWTAFLAAALAAACATPYGYQPILLTFKILSGNEAVQTMAEWRSMFAHNLLDHTSPIDPAFVLALLFLALYYGVRLPVWRLLQILALIYAMLSHVRLASLFSIITPILLMGPVTHQFRFLRLETDIDTNPEVFHALSRASRSFLYPISSLLILAALAFGFFGPSVSPASNITPVGAVDYMVKEKLRGNIYNYFDFGGYLVFRGIKTFVDGRTDQLFSDGFIASLNLYREPNGFFPLLQKHDISLALVKPHTTEADELERSPFWNKVYSDDVSCLYERIWR